MKIFENKGEEAATAEVDQLYKWNLFETIIFKDITKSKRRKYCDAIMLLTKNNNGDVKGRSVFNGNSHVYGWLKSRKLVQLQQVRVLW